MQYLWQTFDMKPGDWLITKRLLDQWSRTQRKGFSDTCSWCRELRARGVSCARPAPLSVRHQTPERQDAFRPGAQIRFHPFSRMSRTQLALLFAVLQSHANRRLHSNVNMQICVFSEVNTALIHLSSRAKSHIFKSMNSRLRRICMLTQNTDGKPRACVF